MRRLDADARKNDLRALLAHDIKFFEYTLDSGIEIHKEVHVFHPRACHGAMRSKR